MEGVFIWELGCIAMNHLELKTYWSSNELPYGAFDDYLIIRSKKDGTQIQIQIHEFDYLMNLLFNEFQNGKIEYFDILKKWNEHIDVFDSTSEWFALNDHNKFTSALELVEGHDQPEYGKITKKDLKMIREFFQQNDNSILEISML